MKSIKGTRGRRVGVGVAILCTVVKDDMAFGQRREGMPRQKQDQEQCPKIPCCRDTQVCSKVSQAKTGRGWRGERSERQVMGGLRILL